MWITFFFNSFTLPGKKIKVVFLLVSHDREGRKVFYSETENRKHKNKSVFVIVLK
jgi:hypothetical protein